MSLSRSSKAVRCYLKLRHSPCTIFMQPLHQDETKGELPLLSEAGACQGHHLVQQIISMGFGTS